MKAARFFGFLAVLLIVLAVGGILGADALAKSAIRTSCTSALGVETRLDSASVGLFSGTFEFSGLAVDNPPGFPSEDFLTLDGGRLEVGPRSLLGQRVEAPLLVLNGARIALESQDGRTNYGALLEHLRSAAPSSDQDAAKGGKEFVLERVELRDVVVHFGLGAATLTSRGEVVIPEIVLTGLDGHGFTLEELTALLIEALLEHAGRAGLEHLPRELLERFGGRLDELVDLQLGGKLDDVDELREAGETLKDLFQRR